MFWPFSLKLGAQLTFYAGMILAFSAGAAWLREDAKKDAQVEVRAEFEAANAQLRVDLAAKEKKLGLLQNVLLTTEKEAARLQDENTKLLEKQRETVPLSDACDQCRIPNERLWRRPGRKAAPASATRGPST